MTPHERLAALREARFNTARLPAERVPCDLSTDVEMAPGAAGATDAADAPGGLDAAIAATFGDLAWAVTPRGRVAEAAIVRALVGQGQVVLANEVYVTGAWSIRRQGARVEVLEGTCQVRRGRGPIEVFDLDAAARRLERGDVACLWLTTPRVGLGAEGGAALDLASLRGLAALRDRLAPALPIVVDATKIGEWAARAEEPAERALRDLGRLADVLVISARKELGGIPRGLLLWRRHDRTGRVVVGAGSLGERHCGALACGLENLVSTAAQRWSALRGVAAALERAGAPLLGWGGGAIFLDAQAVLPAVPETQHPALTLLALLYLRAGLRGLGTPVGVGGPEVVRLSIRECGPWLARHLPSLLTDLATWPSGLVRASGGGPGPFLEPLAPAQARRWEGPWPDSPDHAAPATVGPSTLGAGDGEAFASALRERLGGQEGERALHVQPLHDPRGRLLEVWRRTASDAAALRGAPQLAAEAASWPTAGGCVGDLWLVDQGGLRGALAARRAGDLVALRVEALAELRLPDTDCAPDLWVIAPGLLAREAGALALRPGCPLTAALAESTLFAEGAPGIGGVDLGVLTTMTAALLKPADEGPR
ncbi:MAG: hypothetical protein R3A79_11050 [Nannocystaceae bacterium]